MILNVLPLLSRPSRQGASAILLPGFAFLAVTALLAIVLGGAQTFWGYTDDAAGLYIAFAVIALALLVVPLVSLGAAAARLSARRRDDRLAILRLLGATGRSTAGLAVIEATGIAFIGAFLGAALAYALSPLIGLIHFRGEALGASGVALPLGIATALVLGVSVIAAASALISLRRVIISPLGVALKQSAPKIPWLQALIAIAAILVSAMVVNGVGTLDGFGVIIAALGISFAVTLLAIDLIGAWVLSLFGRSKARRAQKPADLLSARFILESPRAAWRQVSGVAMSSFMAVFAGSGIALMSIAEAEGSITDDPLGRYLIGDVRTGVAITVIGTFLMVACSVAVNQAAQILDRRDVSRSLQIMGTPFEVQDRARRGATMLPLLLASVGSAILAGVLLFPLVGMAVVFAPLSLAITLSSIAVGVLVVVATLTATKPLLRQVVQG
ncbi:permease [Leucobacter coleopterorum]|uniref:Permease n=1 Tax=Leucobacter coleopterorum TaxID=2714933 RepID=A0ABX6JWU2_9MICO|nr:FtsX-like permease family protein [Leucobacter coleopterorum]QIM18053.1 permease [Leucobacter coleopterorum]